VSPCPGTGAMLVFRSVEAQDSSRVVFLYALGVTGCSTSPWQRWERILGGHVCCSGIKFVLVSNDAQPAQRRYASIHSASSGGGTGRGRSRIEMGCRN
jgi:hypothetical protein